MVKKISIYGLLSFALFNGFDLYTCDEKNKDKSERAIIEDAVLEDEIEEAVLEDKTGKTAVFVMSQEDHNTLNKFEEARKNNEGKSDIIFSLEQEFFKKAVANADLEVKAKHLEEQYKEVLIKTAKSNQEAADEKLMAQKIQRQFYENELARESLYGRAKDNIFIGGAQHFGGQIGNALAQAIIQPTLATVMHVWNESKPEYVKERERQAIKVNNILDNLKEMEQDLYQKNSNTYNNIKNNDKILDLMKARIQKMPWLADCDFLQGKMPDGQYIEQFVSKEFYENNKELNQKEMREAGKCIPADLYFKRKLESLEFESLQKMGSYFDKQRYGEKQFLKMAKLAEKERDKFATIYSKPIDPVKANLETAAAIGIKTTLLSGAGCVFFYALKAFISPEA